jgi:hypothetical protein
MGNKLKEKLVQFEESIVPDKARAHEVLQKFSQQVVTLKQDNRLPSMQPWYLHLYNFIFSPIMDAKGILTAAKVLGIIVVLGAIAVFLSVTAAGKKIVNDNIAQVTTTPTATPTPTPTVLLADSSVEEVINQIDQTAAEIDELQKELDALDSSFSTKDIDALTAQLNGIN